MNKDKKYILQAIKKAKDGIKKGIGGPFGAVIVINDKVICKASNQVFIRHDATAHAEIMAIRKAGKKLGNRKLKGATLYTSCEPCPMCFAAAHYAGIERIVFAARHQDAEAIAGFGVKELYQQLSLGPMHRNIPHMQTEHEKGLEPFHLWQKLKDQKNSEKK